MTVRIPPFFFHPQQTTAKNGQEAIVMAIQEFLGANRDPTIVLKQQKQHGEVCVHHASTKGARGGKHEKRFMNHLQGGVIKNAHDTCTGTRLGLETHYRLPGTAAPGTIRPA